MKFLFTLLLLTTSAFAINPQGGNGGNICFLSMQSASCASPPDSCASLRGYRLLDEYQYSWLSLGETLEYRRSRLHEKKESPLFPGVNRTNLLSTRAGKRAIHKLSRIHFYNYKLAAVLTDILYILEETYLSPKRFYLPKGAGVDMPYDCRKDTLEAAILTDNLAFTIISDKAWDLLPLVSQETLLIHETLRLAQTFTPWFKNVSNQDLQKYTMAIYSERSDIIMKSGFYGEFYKFSNSPAVSQAEMIHLNEEIESALAVNNLEKAAQLIFRKGEIESDYKSRPISQMINNYKNDLKVRKILEETNMSFLK